MNTKHVSPCAPCVSEPILFPLELLELQYMRRLLYQLLHAEAKFKCNYVSHFSFASGHLTNQLKIYLNFLGFLVRSVTTFYITD